MRRGWIFYVSTDTANSGFVILYHNEEDPECTLAVSRMLMLLCSEWHSQLQKAGIRGDRSMERYNQQKRD